MQIGSAAEDVAINSGILNSLGQSTHYLENETSPIVPLEIQAVYNIDQTDKMILMTLRASDKELPVNEDRDGLGISISTINTDRLERVFGTKPCEKIKIQDPDPGWN